MSSPASIVRLPSLKGFEQFEHEAMATRFHIYLSPTPEGELGAIAHECFQLLDRIETNLSFYQEGSDVSRINRAEPGETIRIDDVTHRCLLTALDVAAATDGVFDPFAGHAALRAKQQKVPHHLADLSPPPDNDDTPVLAIDPDNPIVTKMAGRRWLDLGAVGKGGALDAMAEHLQHWHVPAAVLVGGGSSILVWGRPPIQDQDAGDGRWELKLPQLPGQPQIRLTAPFALGASGNGFQPGHVVRSGDGLVRNQALALAPEAGFADAFSTAALLLPDERISELLQDVPTVGVVASRENGPLFRVGAFTNLEYPAPLVSLVIPCWKESQRLPRLLEPLASQLEQAQLPVEVLVVDDGSPAPDAEATRQLVEQVAKTFPRVKPMTAVPEHTGKGGTIRHGWHQAAPTSRWLAFVDADGAIPAEEVVRVLQRVVEQDADSPRLYAANRYHLTANQPVRRSWLRQRTGAWFAAYARKQLGFDALDSQCGFKVVPADWMRRRLNWRESGYAFDLELLTAASRDGIRVENVDIAWQEIGGSHVSARDGWKLVQIVRQIRQVPPKALH